MDASDYQDTDDFNKVFNEAAITVQDTVRRKKDELVQTGTPTPAAMPQVGGKLRESEWSAEEDARRLEQRSPRSDRSRLRRVERAPTTGIVTEKEEKKKKANQRFAFLHLLAEEPRKFDLGMAIQREANKRDFMVNVENWDTLRDGYDLLGEDVQTEMLGRIWADSFQAMHSGFPGGSASVARFNKPGVTGPPQVKDREHPYGRPSNNEAQQSTTDRGARAHSSRYSASGRWRNGHEGGSFQGQRH